MRIVVTGASSGIGRSLSLAFAARGDTVVLSARDEEALAVVAREVSDRGGTAIVCAADVTKEADRARLALAATEGGAAVDVLVNNAGRGYYGAIVDVDVKELEDIFALNVIAPLALTQLLLEPLGRVSGAVVMMSSVAGVVSAPKMGAYAASKFALEAISIALRAEVAARGVRVLVVRPGPVDTAFRANAVVTQVEAGVRPPGAKVQTPDDVAELTMRALAKGRDVVETSAFVRVASFASRVTPPLFRVIAKRMAKKD